jgi:hypothetical protein
MSGKILPPSDRIFELVQVRDMSSAHTLQTGDRHDLQRLTLWFMRHNAIRSILLPAATGSSQIVNQITFCSGRVRSIRRDARIRTLYDGTRYIGTRYIGTRYKGQGARTRSEFQVGGMGCVQGD